MEKGKVRLSRKAALEDAKDAAEDAEETETAAEDGE